VPPPVLVVVTDGAFLPALTVVLARPLVAARSYRDAPLLWILHAGYGWLVVGLRVDGEPG
jgi:uncharacterized protein involved in response to NO